MADKKSNAAQVAAAATVAEIAYMPNRTLGRSGYVEDAFSRLGRRLAQLDALMCFINDQDVQNEDVAKGEDLNAFQRLNNSIQRSVFDLASDLAQEAHELHEQLSCAGAEAALIDLVDARRVRV